jgi:Zn-dependent peptidase ImmA (M78 family)
VSELVADDRELLPRAELPAELLTSSAQEAAQRARRRFAIPVETQRTWGATNAFRRWRGALQEAGIIVMTAAMPRDDCRGLAVPTDGDLVPIIVVTTDDSQTGRIFTLFHEYGHLLRRTAAFCGLSPEAPEDEDDEERWCDRFAAAFLMPEGAVRALVAERYAGLALGEWDMRHVASAARYFSVSPWAMAWRLWDLGITRFVWTHRDDLYERDRQAAARRAQNDEEGGPPSYQRVARQYGTAATTVITDALHRGLIVAGEASEALGIPPQDFGKLEAAVEAQRERETA